MELPSHAQDKNWVLTNGLRGKSKGGFYFLSVTHLEGFPFSTFPGLNTKSKSASSRAILSVLVHPDVMNPLIKQHGTNEKLWGKLF